MREREVASILLGKGKGGEGEGEGEGEIEKGQIVKKRKRKKGKLGDSILLGNHFHASPRPTHYIYIIQIQYLIRSYESDSHFE